MAAPNIDPESNDYDFKSIEPDARFKQTTKEVWSTMITFIVYIALMTGNLFVFGGDPSTYVYVGGFPLWILLEIIIIIAMVCTVLIIVNFVYKDMDVTPHGRVYPHGYKGAMDSEKTEE